MECTQTRNLDHCTCTYAACDKRGHCCACVTYHQKRGEIPGCFFTKRGEALWDRSLAALLQDRGAR